MPHGASAAETVCFRLEADKGQGCPTEPNTIEVTPGSTYDLRVVYDPKGGSDSSGVTVDVEFTANLGALTAGNCSDSDSDLGPAFDPITVNGQKLTATYFSITGATSGIAKLMKCTFPAGTDGVTGTLTWKTDTSGEGTALVLDGSGGVLNSAVMLNATIEIKQPPCTQPSGNSSLTATPKNVGGTPTCELSWTAPPGVGSGSTCALAANPFAITQDGNPVTGSPFAAGTTTATINTGLAFDTTYNYSLVTSTTGGALAAVNASCKPQEGEAPTVTFTPPSSALVGTDLKVNGTYSDSDSNSIKGVTLYYTVGGGSVKTVSATLGSGRAAQAVNGSWTATVPGADILEGQEVKFIAKALDDLDLVGLFPASVAEADLVNGAPDAAAFAKVNCAQGPCIAGDNVIVGTALAFLDTDGDGIPNGPVPSEMPFNPTDANEPAANRPGLDIQFAMNAPSQITARIYTLNGHLIRQLPPNNGQFLPNSCHYLQGCNWDGTDFGANQTDYVPNGMYIVSLVAVCNTNPNAVEGTCPTAFTGTTVNLTKGIVVMK